MIRSEVLLRYQAVRMFKITLHVKTTWKVNGPFRVEVNGLNRHFLPILLSRQVRTELIIIAEDHFVRLDGRISVCATCGGSSPHCDRFIL